MTHPPIALRQTSRRAVLRALPVAALGVADATAVAQPAGGGSELAVQVVKRFWDAFNRAAWSELDGLVTPNYAHHPPGKTLTLDQFKAGGAWVHKGLGGYRLEFDSVIASGSDVATRWTATGTHVGSMFGEAPTNRQVAVQGMHFHTVSAGRIAADWEVIDFDGFKAQLRRG
ncbi:MAG: ester cyclase [Vicinamibacterales bacterium]